MWLVITLACANALCSVVSIEQSNKNCKQENSPYDSYHTEATYCVHLKTLPATLKLNTAK